MILGRTVTRIAPEGGGERRPLSDYGRAVAYVLLGDPGSGKTTAFRREADAAGGSSTFVSVRDFLALDPGAHPEWKTGPLFLDGLDEARAGRADGRTPLDAIRGHLDSLGRPPFRLSCREADWLGNNDRKHLESVSADGAVVVLRLDSLDDNSVGALVESRLPDAESGVFLAEAFRRGMGEILRNPQTLDLLLNPFGETGGWPGSHREVMERGVRQLARETNQEHRIAQAAGTALPSLDVSAVLDAAGWISAVHLLGGGVPHTLSPSISGGDDVVEPADYGEELRFAVRSALRTRLFAARGDGRFEPVHANLAAFLAARTLADLVGNGLPGSRVLSLLGADDGAPPTPLRGLAAWLAALSPALRRSLIKGDPVAVLMYGDVVGFTVEEKGLLLRAVARDSHRFHETRWSDMACRALAGADMTQVLREVVEDPDRSDSKFGVRLLAVEALGHGAANSASRDSLLRVVRDRTRGLQLRVAAFDGWVRHLPEGPQRIERLRSLLDEVRQGTVEDRDRELLGSLLETLYPGALGPRELWAHVSPPTRRILGRLWRFLNRLGAECPAADLREHLDILASSADGAREKLARLDQQDLAAALLSRAVQLHGDHLATPWLVDWLRVGLDDRGFLRPRGPAGDRASNEIREWLGARPETQKAIIRLALRTEPIRSLESPSYYLEELLYRCELPEDIGRWHLDEAVATRTQRLRRSHLREFVGALDRRPVGLDAALAEARMRLAEDAEGLRFLDGLLNDELPRNYLEHRIRYRHLRRRKEGDSGLLAATRSQRKELDRNSATPGLLDALARLYYRGFRRDGPRGGRRQVIKALGGDEQLGQLAVLALSRSVERPDLPSAQELLRLRRRDRMSAFIWPVLMGLAERAPDEITGLTERRLKSVLTCRLLQPGLAQEAPWYERCIAERPDLVAEVLVAVGRVLLAKGDRAIPDFYMLTQDDLRAVARRAVLPLLRAFPARARRAQLPMLDALLCAGLHQLERRGVQELSRIVARKAQQGSTTKAARVRWMAGGLLLDPERYMPLLSEQLSGVRAPLDGLEDFLQALVGRARPGIAERLNAGSLEFFIRTLGSQCRPVAAEPGVLWTRGETTELVGRLVRTLAGLPGREPTHALGRLASDSALAAWRPWVERALSEQRVLRRDASHVFPDASAVIEALRNRAPASAADLRALVLDRLTRLGRELRTTNANLWRQFWNEPGKSWQAREPKHENACRDALLAMLRPLLPGGCDAQPEGQYARNRRADIRVVWGRWNVPVEIKKNAHRNLWRAARDQLLASYANDPATGGLGVYLVLWFGPEETTPLERGRRPKTPRDLQEAVERGLTRSQRSRARVVVMDVTPP